MVHRLKARTMTATHNRGPASPKSTPRAGQLTVAGIERWTVASTGRLQPGLGTHQRGPGSGSLQQRPYAEETVGCQHERTRPTMSVVAMFLRVPLP